MNLLPEATDLEDSDPEELAPTAISDLVDTHFVVAVPKDCRLIVEPLDEYSESSALREMPKKEDYYSSFFGYEKIYLRQLLQEDYLENHRKKKAR